jgi:hypothetical protein
MLPSFTRAVRLAVTAAVALSLCLLGTAGALAAPTAHRGPPANLPVPLKAVHLTPRYAKHGTPSITVPRNHRSQTNSRDIPLQYQGGPIQGDPQVYVLFWGLWWASKCPGQQGNGGTDESYLLNFYSGLGRTSDIQSPVDSQYFGPAGVYPQFPVSPSPELRGSAVVCSNPPQSATDAQLAAEADSYASMLASGGTTINNSTQIVVVSPSGTNPGGGFGTQYCAYHNWTTYSGSQLLSWTNLPYMPDQGSNCGADLVIGPEDGWSIVGGHENNESVTDPFGNAWLDANGNEIGDKCAWTGLYAENLSTGTVAMQPEYDNNTASCQEQATFANGEVNVINHGTYCMSDSTTSGAQAKLRKPCVASGNGAGHWVQYPDGTLRRYYSSGECLQPTSASAAAAVVVEPCVNSTAQHWTWQSSSDHWVNGDGKCLKAASITSGALMTQANCSGTAATQKFHNV